MYLTSVADDPETEKVSLIVDINEENRCGNESELFIRAEVAASGEVLATQFGVEFIDGSITFEGVSRGIGYTCTVTVLLQHRAVESRELRCGRSECTKIKMAPISSGHIKTSQYLWKFHSLFSY